MNKEESIGKIYGRWTILNLLPNNMCEAKCSCGKYKISNIKNIRKGKSKSCGCLRAELQTKKLTIHGLKNHRIYIIWKNMNQRCSNPNHPNYHRYGGRGVSVCYEWIHNPKMFYDWSITNGYKDNLTIDRMNNDGNYSPENCRWTTQIEQGRNKSSNHLITHDGITKCISEWAEQYGLKIHTLIQRVVRHPHDSTGYFNAVIHKTK